jgi:hypothetical protein
MTLPVLLVVAPEETSFVPAPEEAPFVVPALKEVVALEAMMAAAMVAVVPTKEPTVEFTAQHTLETVRCDAAQYPFGQWAAQHATARAATRVAPSATTAAEELAH